MSEFDFLRELLEKPLADFAEKTKVRDEIISSQSYQNELKFISRMTDDVLKFLSMCLICDRNRPNSDHSLVVYSYDELILSALAVKNLAQEGLVNPIKRELRYIIESFIKYLYVDQQVRDSEPFMSLKDRLDFLDRNVNSSIDIRQNLELYALHPDDAKQFIAEVYDLYRDCCAYVHVSRQQIEERIKLKNPNRPCGYMVSDKELQKISRLIFRVYDVALTLFMHGYGIAMTGDIFVSFLDDLPDWKFHKGKYVGVVSAYFDYKHERNMRKYGEPRPWLHESWPLKKGSIAKTGRRE
jgi:hypothetical protein